MRPRGRRRRQFPRWDGILGIGDRIAFRMPGEDYVVAGNIEDIRGEMLVVKMRTEARTSYRVVVARGLVVENKSEVFRKERKAKRNRNRASKENKS